MGIVVQDWGISSPKEVEHESTIREGAVVTVTGVGEVY
jgi:hypothetical protein